MEDGTVNWKTVVSNFYPDLEEAVKMRKRNWKKIEIEDEVTEEKCELMRGNNMVIKYIPWKILSMSRISECRNTKPYLRRLEYCVLYVLVIL